MRVLTFRRKQTVSHFSLISTLLVFLLFIAPLPAFAQDTSSIDALRQMGRAFADIAEKTSPAVVGIKATKTVTQNYPTIRESPFGDFFKPFGDDFFDRFFYRRFPRQYSPQREYDRPVEGSGFIVSHDGYILTANHLVGEAENVEVKLADGRDFEAKVIGSDPDSDVAVIKIDAGNLPFLELADSDVLEVGEWVIAIGNPFGLSHTVTAGIVSAKGRSGFRFPGHSPEYQDYIQTDAAINFGNSGGPLINLDGKAVGINTAIIGSGGNIGIGFAIPINIGKFIYERLIKGEPIARGVLGVYIRDLNPDLAESLGLEETKGALVSQVIEGSAADEAGIKRYDVIVEFEGEKIKKADELRSRVATLKPGTKAKLVLIRDGKRETLNVKIGASSTLAQSAKASSETLEQLGLTVRNLTDDLAERLGYEDLNGVVVTRVEPGSEAARRGIEPGTLIMEINRKIVKNTKDFNEAIEEAAKKGKVLFLISDGRYNYLVILKLPKE